MNLTEIKETGIYNSQISRPDVNVSKDRKVTDFELEIPLENGGISYIDGIGCPVTRNLFICSKPGQLRHTKFPFKCRYIHLSVSDEYLYELLSSLPDFISIPDPGAYTSLFDELYKFSFSGIKHDKIMCQSILLKLIHTLYTDAAFSLDGNPQKYGNVISRAAEYIDKNLASELSLESVARQVSFSPIYFHNCFKNATGKTLHNYIEEKRIEKSINLMLTTDMTLTQIAYNCGFSSQSYYSYVFKRRMNTTPRKYIRKLNNNYKI